MYFFTEAWKCQFRHDFDMISEKNVTQNLHRSLLVVLKPPRHTNGLCTLQLSGFQHRWLLGLPATQLPDPAAFSDPASHQEK